MRIFVITETGVYISDGAKDTSHWVKMPIDEIFVNKAGDLIIKQDRSSRQIEVYTRGQEQSHATTSDAHRLSFSLTQTFTGNSFEAFDSVLVVSKLEQKKY